MADDAPVRDQLALDRTLLANERTLLAYLRTALGLFGAGAALLHFFTSLEVRSTGIVLVVLGFVAIGVGLVRFRAVRAHVYRVMHPPD